MENSDILIVILMFAAPIISAVLDNRKKAKKKAEQAARQARHPQPYTSFDFDIPDVQDDDAEDGKTIVFEPPKEGEKMFQDKAEAPIPEPEEQLEEREKIDVRKLIVYDAIMHPKFKEQED